MTYIYRDENQIREFFSRKRDWREHVKKVRSWGDRFAIKTGEEGFEPLTDEDLERIMSVAVREEYEIAADCRMTSTASKLTSYHVSYGNGPRNTWKSYRQDTYSLDTALKRADSKRAEGYEVEIEEIAVTTITTRTVL